MNKVVFNACYGGFSLSTTAMEWLAENGREEIKAIAEECLRKQPDNKYGYHAYEFDRHDPDLVRCVEILGSRAAGGRSSKLVVRELKGNRYRIEEYDGSEEVYEPEDEDYITIK